MKYEPEEFELLKEHVEEFMKRGPLGDLFSPFFYRPYPYNQTGNELDTLRFADVRKMLIDFLYKRSRAKSIEVTRQTENLIGEIWEYGLPEKKRELDFMKSLSWGICNMARSVDYWEWEAMRLPGESESDVVRRTYQEIKDPVKRYEIMERWYNYLEHMKPKYELQEKIAEVLVKLSKASPDFEAPEKEGIKELVENKHFLDSEKYQDAIIYYILKKEQDGKTSYKGFAEYEQELALYFSFSEEEVSEIYMGDTCTDDDLFEPLEDGYKIAAMTMDGHLGVWYELQKDGIGSVAHKKGLEDYLIFCREKNITAAAITAATGWRVQDLFQMMEQQKKENLNKRNQADRHTSR